MRAVGAKSPYRQLKPKQPLSTFPFSDCYPWDEELIRAGRRAVSTHGPSYRPHVSPLSRAREA